MSAGARRITVAEWQVIRRDGGQLDLVGAAGQDPPGRVRRLPGRARQVNGVRVKPVHAIRAGDEVRLRQDGRERVVVVVRVITKRVGAPAAAGCYGDNSPPCPPREEAAVVAVRDRGTGRPTKRERRSIEKLFGRPAQ
jgi:ribosome-associated heat shock protein Hsp15